MKDSNKNNFAGEKTTTNTMIPLHTVNEFSWVKEHVRSARKSKIKFASEKEMVSKIKKFGYVNAKMATTYLLLSAKTPFVENKGYINAVSCHSIFPADPNIQFPWWSPQDHSFFSAGKLEIHLTNLEEHQNLTVEIRLNGFSNNSSSAYEVRSSITPGLYGYFPIQIDSKIDLFFPDIDSSSGTNTALITIEAIDMNGSWNFYDAKINIIE